MTAPHPRSRPPAERNVRALMAGPRRAPRRLRVLALCNRQQLQPVDLRLLRRVVEALLREVWLDGSYDLTVNILAAPEMTDLNEKFLRHKGSTDVITFDYVERVAQAFGVSRGEACPALLHGELFVCIDEAVSQARGFRTIWQSELVRYIVHGVLHLLGHDDHDSRSQRRMKQAEETLLGTLARSFPLRSLGARKQRDV